MDEDDKIAVIQTMKTVSCEGYVEPDGGKAENEGNRGVQRGVGEEEKPHQAANAGNRQPKVGIVAADLADSRAEVKAIRAA